MELSALPLGSAQQGTARTVRRTLAVTAPTRTFRGQVAAQDQAETAQRQQDVLPARSQANQQDRRYQDGQLVDELQEAGADGPEGKHRLGDRDLVEGPRPGGERIGARVEDGGDQPEHGDPGCHIRQVLNQRNAENLAVEQREPANGHAGRNGDPERAENGVFITPGKSALGDDEQQERI